MAVNVTGSVTADDIEVQCQQTTGAELHFLVVVSYSHSTTSSQIINKSVYYLSNTAALSDSIRVYIIGNESLSVVPNDFS